MARAEVSITVEGTTHTLAMTIGALEEIAMIEEVMLVLAGALETGTATLAEVKGVLAAGLKASEAEIDAGVLIEEIGIEAARQLAFDAIKAGFKAPEGEFDAILGRFAQLGLMSTITSSLGPALGGDLTKPDPAPSQT